MKTSQTPASFRVWRVWLEDGPQSHDGPFFAIVLAKRSAFPCIHGACSFLWVTCRNQVHDFRKAEVPSVRRTRAFLTASRAVWQESGRRLNEKKTVEFGKWKGNARYAVLPVVVAEGTFAR